MRQVEGLWVLLSWAQKYDDGRFAHPLGEAPTGQLIYTASQEFSVFISRSGRQLFTTGGQWTANVEEKAQAYDDVLAYIGQYEFDGITMKHHVKASLFPNWEGHTQLRQVELDSDKLTLRGRMEENTPEARTAELVWRRIGS